MDKKKIKEFWGKYKKPIIIIGATGGAIVSGIVGYSIGQKKLLNKFDLLPKGTPIIGAVMDACEKNKGGYIQMVGIWDENDSGFAMSKLGELGELMLEKGKDIAPESEFTHFIAIGKKND